MSNNNLQTNTSSPLHNVIMEADGKDRPLMLARGNYIQWKSRIKRYINTKPNRELIHYYLEHEPYKYQFTETPDTHGIDGDPPTWESNVMETYATISEENRKKINAEAEAVQIILTGIDNDIYSTFDACKNNIEMWKEIERLKQSESINVQDLETNLYWEFGKFTSRDGESLDSYYSMFYKMMNKLVRNKCGVTNQQLNIRVESLAITNNPLALVAATQQPIYHPQPKSTHYNQSSSTISQSATRNKGNEIANTLSSTYNSKLEAVSNEEATLRDKDIEKPMALNLISFKKIYKPTNNNLRTLSKTRNKNVDNTPRSDRRIGYGRQTRKYENQRVVNVARARDTIRT
ncbi:hypothetical protein Tco_1468523 [Tanacetum coccineum]